MVSIILPIFNAEPYLRRCLDSVLAQGPLVSEILLIDDGSTDNSGEICDEYACKNESIHVFHTKNNGASLARRYGLELARADYVSFVDSDDFVSPRYVSLLFEIEKRFRTGISAGLVLKIQPGENIESSTSASTIILEGDILFHRFFHYEFWGLCGKLYKKDLLMEIPFPKATISEDYSIMANLFAKNPKIAYTSTPLYFYEQHHCSLSHSPISDRSFDEFDNVREVYDFTSLNLPDYRLNALSNAVETAVKLLWATRKSEDFLPRRRELKAFLTEHRREIPFCPNLFSKTKAIAIFYAL